jgi:cysteine desulfurase / selenocysteine lyase
MNQMQMTTAFDLFRQEYPGTRKWTYFDVAARGLLSRGVRKAMDKYLDHRMDNGADKAWMFSMGEKARERFAALIGASADEVALTKNVTEGINAFACAVDWKPGDNVVICTELEHPANIYPWYNLARQRGIEVKTVAADNGRVSLERMSGAVDARTRVVSVSDASFSPGFRAPVKALGQFCRRAGVLLLVDAAQTVGVLHTDVDAMQVDCLSVATQKGLLGMYGMGFLYVRRQIAEQMQPSYISRMGIQLEETHEAAIGDPSRFKFASGARRFDVGNCNFIGAIAVAQSISELTALGSLAIENHVCSLAGRLAEGLSELGLPVFGGADARDRAHIVAVGSNLSDQHDSTDNAVLRRLHEALLARKVRHTIRRGVVRLSLHAYNNADDVDEAISIARDFLKTDQCEPRTQDTKSS